METSFKRKERREEEEEGGGQFCHLRIFPCSTIITPRMLFPLLDTNVNEIRLETGSEIFVGKKCGRNMKSRTTKYPYAT